MRFPRESGILLHPTSLPGPYGIGEIGPSALAFVEKLEAMGQHLWQVLPLGPTGYGDSPYQSLSTFAGNHLLISFEQLVEDGLLSREQLIDFPTFSEQQVDYGTVIPARNRVLVAMCCDFEMKAGRHVKQKYQEFCGEHSASWLDDYALFVALKNAHQGKPWTEWDSALAHRQPDALNQVRRRFQTQIENVKILQFLFFEQWQRVLEFCHNRRIRVVGDIPIFVAHDSADVWANRELFFIDETGNPTVVAGVPPDYFSATGQRWGNPLYRWDVIEASSFDWWKKRLHGTFQMFDIVRIDHFRGFESYWEIPSEEPTAMNGRWVPGPGAKFFEALKEEFGDLPIIAEDLGLITPEVHALRDAFEFPGMRVLQFTFGKDEVDTSYWPETYPTNCVCYTGTHDNDTAVGWFWSNASEDSTRTQEQIERERREVLNYVGTDGSEIHWDLIGVAMRSPANTVIIPLQDVLGLDSGARMNIPGQLGGNWRWRMTWKMITPEIESRLRRMVEASERNTGVSMKNDEKLSETLA